VGTPSEVLGDGPRKIFAPCANGSEQVAEGLAAAIRAGRLLRECVSLSS